MSWRTQGFMSVPPAPGGGFGSMGDASPSTPELEQGAPPSSYAVVDVLDGQQGSLIRLVGLTLLRGVFIAPGLWVTARLFKIEMEPMQLLALSFGGSATISAGMVGYYAIRRAVG